MKLEFVGREVGKKHVRKLRVEGLVPVICYNKDNSEPLAVSSKDLNNVIKTGEVVVEGEGKLKGKSVLFQDIARDPLTQDIIHADFMFVDKNKMVEHKVPLEVVGEAPGVKKGGLLVHPLNEILIKALPADIPKHIEVDVSGLEEIGQHIAVSDLNIADNIEVLAHKEEIVISIIEQKEEEPEPTPSDIDFENIEVEQKGKGEEEGEAKEEDK